MSKKKLRAVDLYCGAGGTSSGLVQAVAELGLDVELTAINHWDVAIDTHSRNYPKAKHLCTSLDNLNPREVIPGGHLNLLVASPECTHHSIARGGKPVNEQNRASAWCILRWAEAIYIENILVENVREFMDWGPVGRNGQPIKRLKGELFLRFIENLKALAYRVEYRKLNAADYGDPTTRERLFVMASRKRKTISWPTPTHSRTGQATEDMFGKTLKPWVPAKEIIDWTLEGQDIFTRKKPLADNTLRRIFAGLEKFGGEAAQPFLVILRGTGGTRSVDLPVPAITAQGKHIALAEPFMLGQQSCAAPRSVGQPVPTIATEGAISLIEPYLVNMKGTSNAVDINSPTPAQTTTSHLALAEPVLQPFMVDIDHTGSNGKCIRSTDEPVSTVTSKQRTALCEPFVLPNEGVHRGNAPRSTDQPLPTITSRGAGAVIEPFIVAAGGPEGQGRTPKSVEQPMGTILTENHQALCEPFIVGAGGPERAGEPRTTERPLNTVLTRNTKALIESFIVPNFGERDGQQPRTHSLKEPLPAVTGHGAGALIEPFIVPQFSQHGPKSVDDPLGTITTTSRGVGLVEPFVVSVNHGNGDQGEAGHVRRVHDLESPLPAVTTKNGYGIAEAAVIPTDDPDPFLTKYYATAKTAQSVDEPLDTVTTKERFALVQPIVNGMKLEIRFRMLQPHELAAAQSFSPTYQFAGNKSEVTKQIGNAVPVNLAKALITELLK